MSADEAIDRTAWEPTPAGGGGARRPGWAYLWGYRARSGREKEFEALYGPGGGWARLLGRSPAYMGTRLLRSDEPGRYVTLDLWTDEVSHRAFVAAHATEWEELDRRGEALTVEEVPLGEFEVTVAED